MQNHSTVILKPKGCEDWALMVGARDTVVGDPKVRMPEVPDRRLLNRLTS
jgi:hypothetical protein